MKISAILLATIFGFACATALSQSSRPIEIKSFEFLGCSGDWNGELKSPEIWRITSENSVTFLTHHVADCGLSGHNPRAIMVGNSLQLSYELASPSESVVMCDCEYWAKFSIAPNTTGYTSATINGERANLLGDWPDR